MVSSIAISSSGSDAERIDSLDVLMVAFFGIAAVVFSIYIFDYYRKEKRRKETEDVYKLYKITFENNGETYFQIIGAMSEKGAEQVFLEEHKGEILKILDITEKTS